MNEYLSKKFRFISLISMVAVVFMHTYNKKYKYAPVPNYEGILKILTLGATFRNPAGLVPTVIIPKGMVVFLNFVYLMELLDLQSLCFLSLLDISFLENFLNLMNYNLILFKLKKELNHY